MYIIYFCYAAWGIISCIYLFVRWRINYSWADIVWLALVCYNINGIWRCNQLLQCCLLISVYLTSKCIGRTKIGLRIILVALLIAGLIQVVVGELQVFQCIPSLNAYFLMTGSFDNPGIWGGFMVVTMGVLLGAMNKLPRIICWAILLILGLNIIYSDSRAAWLAGCTAVAWKMKLYWKIPFKKWLAGIGSICIVFMLFSLFIYKPNSAYGRLLIWQVCSSMISEQPLTGSGWGTFSAQYMPHQATFIARTGNESNLFTNNAFAFNEFIHVFCDQGIIGLILVLTLIFLLLRRYHSTELQPFQIAFIAFLTFACFSYPCSLLLTNIQLAILTGVLSSSYPTIATIPFFSKVWKWIEVTIFCVLAFVLSIRFMEYYRIEQALHNYLYRADYESLKFLETHVHQVEQDKIFMLRYARILYMTGDYEHAIPALEQAIALYPTTDKYCDLGHLYEANGNLQAAETMYRNASCLLPHLLYPYYCLLILYEDEGQIDQAREMALRILSISPKIDNEQAHHIRYKAQTYLFLQENKKRQP